MIDDDIRRSIAQIRNYMAGAVEFSALSAFSKVTKSHSAAVETLRTVQSSYLEEELNRLDRELLDTDHPKVVYSAILRMKADLEILLLLQARILSQTFQIPLSQLEKAAADRLRGIDVDWDDVLKSS